MAQDIYVIDDDESSIPIFKELFRNDKEFKFIGVKTEQIDITLKNIPFLIIINEDSIDRDITGLCKQIRTDEDNQITPIIVVSSNTDKYHKLEVLEQSVEYYIKKDAGETITQAQVSQKYEVSSRTLGKRYKALKVS